ncbi:MAG: hypothetical protein ACD_77C00493G0001 [uncultured bacterium]|nr:MAG: hypothetical protein ACD_77C00493G0001 [uncultured bacterium]HBY01595.1 DUF4492 domain-containing protein [Rikenellaceae bacterium]
MSNNIIKRIWLFYYEGFKGMTLGKTLWLIIIIKLFILFFILKLFFFRGELSSYSNEEEKSRHVIEKLTTPN